MKIAILPGDGIGQEIMVEAEKVLDVLRRDGMKIETERAAIGGTAYDQSGDPLPDATLKLAQQADAILFGAVGGTQYDALPRDKRPERAILRMRKELDLFANLRPATVFPELAAASSLKPEIVAGLDLMILRRYLLRPAARCENRERRARRLQYHGVQGKRNSPHRPRRL
jgi:3-isopropylmalate dehydrogenase